MDTWRSDVFFSVGEAATSKWTHGEVAVFGSTVYKIFALKFQKLRNDFAILDKKKFILNSFILTSFKIRKSVLQKVKENLKRIVPLMTHILRL